jgi:eukaryotic-like serine/threonine-protein kinase
MIVSLLRDFRAERLIARLMDARNQAIGGEERAQLVVRLRRLGDTGIRKLVQALGQAGRDEAGRIGDLLGRLLDNETLPVFAEALTDPNGLVVARVAQILATRSGFDPNRLVDGLANPQVARAALLDVLAAHKARLDVGALLRHAYTLEATERNALFRLIAEVADESVIPELLSRVSGKDAVVRQHLVRILSRFRRPDVVAALKRLLADPDRGVRQAALEGLSAHDDELDVRDLCGLLRDPDMKVQEKAIEAIVRLNDPDTVAHLSPLLHDESEHVRRAAVEVLNSIGTSRAIKDLLKSVKDADWWVRARSADALARIGGPRVVQAVVDLIRDEDEFIRRSAIEILNSTRDERSLSGLIDALEDSDWWVRERAVDALSNIGNKAAVPALLRMLKRDEEAAHVVLRALAKLGDDRVIHAVLEQLRRPEMPVQMEALRTLGALAGSENAAQICEAILRYTENASPEIREAAEEVRDRLQAKYSTAASLGRGRPVPEAVDDTVALSMLQSPDGTGAGRALSSASRAAPALDVGTLALGDMLGERYRFVRRVGRGAFGTVLLVEDVVIAETLILKVLHPHMAADGEMIRRFVQEMRLSRKITHENVIRIYDFLNIRGLMAISMEYFPSETLAVALENRRPLAQDTALRYGGDIASGMAAAHETGVVHRDLKPGNVLINSRGLVKIVDFGVAAARAAGDQQLTRTGILIGTPKYMAPEQVLGKVVDARSDIYSLGVLMYEMLAGTLPYAGEDQMAVMYQHVQGNARPVREVNPDVPPALAAVVARMMALSPGDRYQTMDEVRQALAGFLD